MLLMTSNTRSGGVGQGRASSARRVAVGAQRRALTDDGAEGIRLRRSRALFCDGSPSVTSRLLYSNLPAPFFA